MSEAKPVSRERRVGVTYLGCRNQLLTVLKNAVDLEFWKMMVSITLAWIGLAVMFIVQEGDFERSREVARAFGWVIKHSVEIRNKRRWVQRELSSDDKWMKKVVVTRELGWYFGKGWAYVTGRGF